MVRSGRPKDPRGEKISVYGRLYPEEISELNLMAGDQKVTEYVSDVLRKQIQANAGVNEQTMVVVTGKMPVSYVLMDHKDYQELMNAKDRADMLSEKLRAVASVCVNDDVMLTVE